MAASAYDHHVVLLGINVINTKASINLSQSEKTEYPLSLAVFPLPLFILPGGVQRLRIFEPRYLTMVSQATNGDGFVMARYDKNAMHNVAGWGTRVQIIDFDMDDDGVLVIDVRGQHLVRLEELYSRDDGLLMAKTDYLPHWTCLEAGATATDLATLLKSIFDDNDKLAELYQQVYFDSGEWVCARFLELLPLSLNDKEKFIEPSSYIQLKQFLHTFIFGNEKLN